MREDGFTADGIAARSLPAAARQGTPPPRPRRVSALRTGAWALGIVAVGLKAQPGLEPFHSVAATAPERVELAAPRAMNDGGVIAGPCTLHITRSSKDGDDTSHDHRAHSEGIIPGVGESFFITEIYILKAGAAQVIRIPNSPGGDPSVVALNNRGQMLLSRPVANGSLYYLCDVETEKLVPLGLMATVDEAGAPRTSRLKYLTGLNEAGEVYGVYDGPLGHCAVVGAPSQGTSVSDPAPQAPAPFKLLGSVKGNLHIAAINAKGQMTGVADGHLGFLWSGGQLTKFVFPGSTFTTPERINEAGLVAGWFRPFNDVRDDGQVANHKGNIGINAPEKGFVYDGSQFRLVSVPAPGNGSETLVRALTDSGTVLGTSNVRVAPAGAGSQALFQAFTVAVDALPIAHLLPSSGDYTAEAIERWRAAHASAGSPVGFDEAYAIVAKDVGPMAALSLRAFQLLHSERAVEHPGKITLSDSNGNLVNRTLNDYLHDAQGGVAAVLFNQLALAQQTPEGATAVVGAVGAIVGDGRLDDLQAAGSLTDQTLPNEQPADRKTRMLGHTKLLADLDEQSTAYPEPSTSALSEGHLATWQLPEAPADRLAQLTETVTTIQAQFGDAPAATFLACEILKREKSFSDPQEANMRLRQIRARLDGTSNAADLLFTLQAMSALKDLKAQGKAEEALRAVARAPAPGPCPGLDHFAKGLAPPQSDRLVDRTEHSGPDSENLLESLASVEGAALKPFTVSGK